MLSVYQPVRLDKLSEHNAGLLPNGYWCIGTLVDLPRVGACINVLRTERAAREPGEVSPVKCMGVYTSSPVVSMTEREDGSVDCVTRNSIWRITQISA